MFGKRLLFLLVFVLLGQFVFSEKLELNAKKLSANVSVLEEQLDLKVVRGPDQDYSSEKKFGLVIGGCDVKIVTVSSPSLGIMFYISVNGGKPGETVNGWNGIAVNTSVLKFTGIDSNGALSPKSLPCDIAFEAKDDNFMIELELTGSVPLNFKLTSDAELYEQKKEEVSDGHLKTGIYVGLIVLGIVFLAASSTIAGFLIRRRQKKNKVDLAEEKNFLVFELLSKFKMFSFACDIPDIVLWIFSCGLVPYPSSCASSSLLLLWLLSLSKEPSDPKVCSASTKVQDGRSL